MAATATEEGSPTEVLETEEARNLIEAAQAAGRISVEEIALALDELELEPAQLEDVYRALEELQVEIVDAGAEAKEEEARKRQPLLFSARERLIPGRVVVELVGEVAQLDFLQRVRDRFGFGAQLHAALLDARRRRRR